MKLNTNSIKNQSILLEYLNGRRTYKETQRILKEYGDYIEDEVYRAQEEKVKQ